MEFIFVLPENDHKPTADQLSAYNLVQENDMHPVLTNSEFCLTMTKAEVKKTTIYVCDPFGGQVFEHLKKLNCRIIGPKCIIEGEEKKIENLRHPIYNNAMRDLIITYTGFKTENRKEIMEKIQYMGGQCEGVFTPQITHVVADTVGSKKYNVASEYQIPVMTSSWVFECWKKSQTENLRATDPDFDRFKIPIFHGIVVTVTQGQHDDRKRIQQLVEENGGTYTGDLKAGHVTHLIAWEPSGKKFIFAMKWKLHCVTIKWFDDCLSKGYKVPEEPYLLQAKVDSQPFTSSPMTRNRCVANNVSSISNISVSSVNETCMTTFNLSFANPKPSLSLENLEFSIVRKTGENFLDGYRFFLLGFDTQGEEKLRKIINLSGGTRLSHLCESVTHVIVKEEKKLNEVITQLQQENWAPLVVKVQWLVSSFSDGKVADVAEYLLWKPSDTTITSPASEKPESTTIKQKVDFSNDHDETDILSQYMDNNSQGPLDDNIANDCVFKNIVMIIRGFEPADESGLEEIIERNGGQILSADDGAQVPHFAIVPIEGVTTLANVSKIATNVWLRNCVESNRLIPVEEEVLYRPISMNLNLKPLTDCVICISQFMDAERDCLSRIAVLLGAKYQDTLVRKANVEARLLGSTHLVCKEADGGKYQGALRWGLPAVTKMWLIECAMKGKRLPEDSYLVTAVSGTAKINKMSISSKTGNTPASSSSTSFAFNQSDSSIVKTVKKSNMGTQIENLKKAFTPVGAGKPKKLNDFTPLSSGKAKKINDFTPLSSGKPKRLNELIQGKPGSSSQKPETPDSVGAATPSRFLSYAKDFEKKLIFSPEDCPQTPSRDSIGQIQELCDDNFKVAKEQRRKFCPLAKTKVRESGAFFPDEVEKSGPLKGIVVCVCKKLRNDKKKFYDMVAELGGDYRWTYDRTCTHFIHQGKLTEHFADLKDAKKRGIPIVCPEWLQACYKNKRKLSETSFPPNFNPKMMLDISVSQVERPARSTQSQRPERSTQSQIPAEDDSDDSECKEKSVEAKLTDDKTDSFNKSTSDDESLGTEVQAILALSSNSPSKDSEQRKRPGSGLSEPPPQSFPYGAEGNKGNKEPSQSLAIVWDDPTKQTKQKAMEPKSSEPDDETQLNLPDDSIFDETKESFLAEKDDSIKNESGLEKSSGSNKENDDCEAGTFEEAEPSYVRSFMLSGFARDERIQLVKYVEELGGTVSADSGFDETCTHLIANQPSRNEKCLASIVSGIWMLRKSYIDQSRKEGSFTDETLHEWGAPGNKHVLSKAHSQARRIASTAYKWRIQLDESSENKPFYNWRVIIHSNEARTQSFHRLLKAGGATISECPFPYDNPKNVTHAFIELSLAGVAKGVNLKALVLANVECIKPEFIASYLTEEEHDISAFYIPEVKTLMKSLSNDNTKRKSDELNGSSKRNKYS